MLCAKTTDSGATSVKQKIFSVHSLVHTLSTHCPQLIHNAAAGDAPRDHFSINRIADLRSTPSHFDLSNKNAGYVSMMRAGRSPTRWQ
jgi:hypothetical protein